MYYIEFQSGELVVYQSELEMWKNLYSNDNQVRPVFAYGRYDC